MTPRPIYRADGRKILDIYTPPRRSARSAGRRARRRFRSFSFWGPTAGHARRASGSPTRRSPSTGGMSPTLLLVYLPHLDYDLQRLGAGRPADRARTFAQSTRSAARLIAHCRARGRRVVVLSEYGLVPMSTGRCTSTGRFARPDCWRSATSSAPTRSMPAPATRSRSPITRSRTSTSATPARIDGRRGGCCARCPASTWCSTAASNASCGLDHERSGELVAIADRDRVVHLLLLARRPAGARLRAHGRHPPQARLRPGRAVCSIRRWPCRSCTSPATLAKKALGFRYLMKVIPLDATLVKGSHGRITDQLEDGPDADFVKERRRQERRARIDRGTRPNPRAPVRLRTVCASVPSAV